MLRPAAVRCDMVLHRAFRARHVITNKTPCGGEVRHGATSGVSYETSLNSYVINSCHIILYVIHITLYYIIHNVLYHNMYMCM